MAVLQQCFLYCALYPEDHSIPRRELIEYWIAEGLIAEMNSVQDMLDKGHVILEQLINTCLLEKCRDFGKECVKMHDLVRDMALRITANSPRFIVKAGERLKCVPYEEWSEDVERVSLMYSNIEELPIRPPNCPQLTTLLLNGGSFSVISENFFMHMPRLKVLDLSDCNISSLPESISTLEKLHALLLWNCWELNYVPSLEKLSQLQLLRLDGTGLEFSADELLCLRKLKVLGAHFHNVQELTRYATSQQCQGLENYRLIVGTGSYDSPTIEGKAVHITLECEHLIPESEHFGREVDQLVLPSNIEECNLSGYDSPTIEGKALHITLECEHLIPESEHFGRGVDQLVLPSNIEECNLSGCHNLNCLSDNVLLRYARDLIYFWVGECNGIESIFSSSFNSEDDHFPLRTVRSLYLYTLPSLRVLFDWIVPPHNISFNLKVLAFNHCPNMKSIFPVELLQNFPNLERLDVNDCVNVEDIIVESEMSDWGGHHQGSNTIILPNLRYLFLRFVSSLKDIYKGIMVCESLQHIIVCECPMLRRLPPLYSEASAPPALKTIEGDQEWWESLEWDDPHTKTILEPFFAKFPELSEFGRTLVSLESYSIDWRSILVREEQGSWSEGESTDSDDSDT